MRAQSDVYIDNIGSKGFEMKKLQIGENGSIMISDFVYQGNL